MLSVEDMDGFDDLTEEQQDLAQEYFTLGYEDGYDEGYEIAEAESTMYEDGKSAGFEEGILFERNRVYRVCTMHMEWAEQENKGRDYIFWKNVREFLNPDNFKPMDEEDFDKWLSSL